MLASRRNGALHLGCANAIFRRESEHQAHGLGGLAAFRSLAPTPYFSYVDTSANAPAPTGH